MMYSSEYVQADRLSIPKLILTLKSLWDNAYWFHRHLQ